MLIPPPSPRPPSRIPGRLPLRRPRRRLQPAQVREQSVSLVEPPLKTASHLSLRAKGTPISEPRFSTACDMKFFPPQYKENDDFESNPLKKAILPMSRGESRMLQAAENRGSLCSVPLALRVLCMFPFICPSLLERGLRNSRSVPNHHKHEMMILISLGYYSCSFQVFC